MIALMARHCVNMGSLVVALLLLSVTPAASFDRGRTRAAVRLRSHTSPAIVADSSISPGAGAHARGLAVGWGVCGFLGILTSAIGRLAPIAIQPLQRGDLSLIQWGM